MKIRNFYILFLLLFVMIAMLVSCQKRTTSPWPSKLTGGIAIATTAIEIEGEVPGEKLRIEFDRQGKCERIFKADSKEPLPCVGIPLTQTLFCIPPSDKDNHPANVDIDGNGSLDVHCGNVKVLTDGADIQFKAPPAAVNKKCKNVGGDVICY